MPHDSELLADVSQGVESRAGDCGDQEEYGVYVERLRCEKVKGMGLHPLSYVRLLLGRLGIVFCQYGIVYSLHFSSNT